MAKDKPRKRSKHLKVQSNPFFPEDPPDMISPMKRDPYGTSNGQGYTNNYDVQPPSGSAEAKQLEELKKNNKYEKPDYNHKIIFQEVGKWVESAAEFYAFTDSASENFTVNYQQVEKLGSPEPIYQYSGTTKQINLSFKAIEDDYDDNTGPTLQQRINLLKSMTYPVVDASGNPTNPPLVYLTYGQLTEEYASNPEEDTEDYEKYDDPAEEGNNNEYLPRKSNTVFGYITSLSIDYSHELGFVNTAKAERGFNESGAKLKTRMVTFNIGFQQINRGLIGEYEFGTTYF